MKMTAPPIPDPIILKRPTSASDYVLKRLEEEACVLIRFLC
jgi:hypothetical protein